MKSKIFTSLLALACAVSLNAQDIITDFEGTGGATTSYANLDTVLVIENPVPGGDNTSDSVLLYDRINDGDIGIWNSIVYIIPDAATNIGDNNVFRFEGWLNNGGQIFTRLWNDGAMVSGDGTWASPTNAPDSTWTTFTYSTAGMEGTDVDSISLEFGNWTPGTDSTVAATTGWIAYFDNFRFEFQGLDTNGAIPAVVTLPWVESGEIEVDAEIDFAWDDIDFLDSVNNVAIDVHGTGVDVSGQFKACWDNDNVYVWIDVTDDDALAWDAAAAQPWNNEGIEIFTDGGAFNYNTGRVSAQQIQHRINLGYNDNTGNWSLGGDTLTWAEVPAQGGVYSFEVAIPFFVFYRPYQADDAATIDTIPALAVEGELLGIEISILDAEAVDTRDGLLNWSNNSGEDISYTQSVNYGRFILGAPLYDSRRELKGADVSVYPNPANSYVNVVLTGLSRVEICTLDGRVVVQQSARNNKAEINVSQLASGMYIIKAIDANNMYTTSKFQKQQ